MPKAQQEAQSQAAGADVMVAARLHSANSPAEGSALAARG